MDSVVVRHQVVDKIHHSLLEAHIEGLIDLRVAHEALQEVEAVLFINKAAFAFKVVSLDPGSKGAEDGVLELEALFSLELTNKVDSAALRSKLLHLPVVRHD